jgi:hypothetical protein
LSLPLPSCAGALAECNIAFTQNTQEHSLWASASPLPTLACYYFQGPCEPALQKRCKTAEAVSKALDLVCTVIAEVKVEQMTLEAS